jgi:hypothetical protein
MIVFSCYACTASHLSETGNLDPAQAAIEIQPRPAISTQQLRQSRCSPVSETQHYRERSRIRRNCIEVLKGDERNELVSGD